MDDTKRAALIEAHLEAAHTLGVLPLEPRPYFGDLVSPQPVQSATWRGYLKGKAAQSLESAGIKVERVDIDQIVDELPEVDRPSFVDLDAFVGNMLTRAGRITAVIDMGEACLAGDPRFNAVSAAVYVAASEITPTARPRDVQVVQAWLRSAGLEDLFNPVRRWLAVFWIFAVDDRPLYEWCCSVLGLGG